MLCTTYTNFWSIICPLEVRCLTPLSKIFQLLLLWRKLEYPVASHWQMLSHNVVSSTPRHQWGSNSQLKWWYATIAQVVVIRNSSRLSPSEKTSSDMNSILCTAWLMKSHDTTMEDRHPRNVGFSHQGFV
jgi:hypothetical protein